NRPTRWPRPSGSPGGTNSIPDTTTGKERVMHAMRRTVVVATLLALLGVVASFDVSLANDGGAVAQQPEHRLGDGRFAGTVPADQPAGPGGGRGGERGGGG